MATSPSFLQNILEVIKHPLEYRILAQYSVYHEPRRDITSPLDYATTRYNEPTMRRCWDTLDNTAGIYASVVKELDGNLARVICVAYLVFHGLILIENSSTLSAKEKEAFQRKFHQKITKSTWSEKELDHFDAVVAELALLSTECRTIIINTAEQMGAGMADFNHRAATAARPGAKSLVPRIANVTEADLYSHYTGGLIGEAIAKLLVSVPPVIKPTAYPREKVTEPQTTIERPFLAEQVLLSSSYGLLLKKASIIQGVVADAKRGMWLWPKDIVARGGVNSIDSLLVNGRQEGDAANDSMWVLSEMVVNALGHAVDALDFIVLLRNQSVFNFAAFPAAMAIATLELCFMNPQVFTGEVELRRAETVRLITRCTDPHTVAYTIMEKARRIHAKSTPRDPHFLAIGVMCGRIETWVEHHFPSYITFSTGSRTVFYDDTDPRSRIVKRDKEMDEEKLRRDRQAKRDEDMRVWLEKSGVKPRDGPPLTATDVKLHAADGAPWQLYLFVIMGILLVFAMSGGLVVGGLWYFFGEEWKWAESDPNQGIRATFSKVFGIGGAQPLVVQG